MRTAAKAEQARRSSLVDEAYRRVAAMAEECAALESVVADLDDDTFSIDLVMVERALLRFDRDLRARR